MQEKTHIEIKPLKSSRQVLSWLCPDAIVEPLDKYQTWSRTIFRFVLGIITIAIVVISNPMLFFNHTPTNNINEFFFAFFQFDVTMYVLSAVIATFKLDPKLASLFRNLEEIYRACKHLTINSLVPILSRISSKNLKKNLN